MTLLEKLKSLFTRDEIPDEAKLIFDKAKTPADLLRGLDNLLTRNEMEAGELNKEINTIEQRADEEEERIRTGALPERQKRNALLHIKRLRKTMDNYEGRLRIYERNMNLHLNLIGKIQQMEAMKLGGVDEARIDQIVMEFEEKLEKYGDVMNAADAHEGRTATASAREDRELRDLEAEILRKGERPATEPGEAELKAKVRELRATTPAGSDSPALDAKPGDGGLDRPRRRPIEEVIERALESEGEDAAAGAPHQRGRVSEASGDNPKRVELE